MVHNKKYIERPLYIKKALKYVDKNLIKIITGQRRTGKSYIMIQIMDQILKKNPNANIVYVDKELMKFDFIKTAADIENYFIANRKKDSKNYLFIDEVQEIQEFEKALRSLLNQNIVDIWCTGSNAEILSGELADKLSGRYIEIHIHSLSYNEFLTFHGLDNNNDNLFKYLEYGGLPGLINLSFDEDVIFDYLKIVNDTILLKDIIKRHRIRNVAMLENLIKFIADNTGSLFSANSISKYLKAQGQNISVAVINNYISYIVDSFYIIKVKRTDLQGKRIFENNDKYYFEDLGLRNAWVGYQPMHINKLIENVVLKHLVVYDYKVSVGNLRGKEIDFIAEKSGNKIYVQCAYLLPDEKTREREFGNLQKISDNYRKMVVSLDEPAGGNIDGIEHRHLRDFLNSSI